MSAQFEITKDVTRQRPVPTAWRKPLSQVVDCIGTGDFSPGGGIPGVQPLDTKVARSIEESIASYAGVTLAELPEDAWQTSVCQWMGNYRDVIVDLYTESEGQSDLVLLARVKESDSGFKFQILSVHVP